MVVRIENYEGVIKAVLDGALASLGPVGPVVGELVGNLIVRLLSDPNTDAMLDEGEALDAQRQFQQTVRQAVDEAFKEASDHHGEDGERLRQIATVLDQVVAALGRGALRPPTSRVVEGKRPRLPGFVPDRRPLSKPSRVPPRNPLFVGRQRELRGLATAINSGTLSEPRVVVVHGHSRVGKTELLREFVHRYGWTFPGGVFWLDCHQDDTALRREILACVPLLRDAQELPTHLHTEPEEYQVERVLDAWSGPRLIVFDGCTAAQLRNFGPKFGTSVVLATVADATMVKGEAELEVLPLEEREMMELLLVLNPSLRVESRDALERLARCFDGYPEAAQLASPRLNHVSIAEFLAKLSGDGFDAQYCKMVTDTLGAGEAAREAGRVLQCVACFAPGRPVSLALVRSIFSTWGSPEDALRKTERAVALLAGFGFASVGNRAVSVPAPLSRHFATAITPELRRVAADVLHGESERLNNSHRADSTSNLRVHLEHSIRQLEKSEDGADKKRLGLLRCELGRHCFSLGEFSRAAALFDQSLNSTEEGGRHQAEARSNYGQALQELGRFEEAEVVFRQALTFDDPQQRAATHSNYAHLLFRRGDYENAISKYEIVLASCRALASGSQPSSAQQLALAKAHNDLAAALHTKARREHANPSSVGDLGLAREHLEAALRIQRDFGPDDPYLAAIYNNLALVHETTGDGDQAGHFYSESLEFRRKIVGEQHPDTATAHHNQGEFLRKQKRLSEAEPHIDKALEIRTRCLGARHWRTALTIGVQGRLCRDQGRFDEAVTLHALALDILRERLREGDGKIRIAERDFEESRKLAAKETAQ